MPKRGSIFADVAESDARLTEPVRHELFTNAQSRSRVGQREAFTGASNDVLNGRRRLGVRVVGPQVGNGQSAPSNDIGQGAVRDAQRVGDFISGEAFVEKDNGGSHAKARLPVVTPVLRVVKNLKVFNPVVELVSVDVMHVLIGGQRPAKVALHDVSVLKNILLPIDSDSPISKVDCAGPLVDSVAFLGAEKLPRGRPGHRAGLPEKRIAAMGASEGWHLNSIATATVPLSQIHVKTASGEGV